MGFHGNSIKKYIAGGVDLAFFSLVTFPLNSITCISSLSQYKIFSNFFQVPGVTDRGLVPRKIKKVAILGGGLMGSGIATALILSNYPVILKEVNEKFLQAGIDRVRGKDRYLHLD